MADATYQTGVYHKQDGDDMVVAAAGRIDVESGGLIQMRQGSIISAGTATVAASHIADPTGGSTSTGGTATTGGLDTKARAAIVLINAALEGAGITATA